MKNVNRISVWRIFHESANFYGVVVEKQAPFSHHFAGEKDIFLNMPTDEEVHTFARKVLKERDTHNISHRIFAKQVRLPETLVLMYKVKK